MRTDVSLENERFLMEAIAAGRFDNRAEALNEAVRLLREEHESNGSAVESSESSESWTQRFDAWIASHHDIRAIADDSRESIYAGRGE